MHKYVHRYDTNHSFIYQRQKSCFKVKYFIILERVRL